MEHPHPSDSSVIAAPHGLGFPKPPRYISPEVILNEMQMFADEFIVDMWNEMSPDDPLAMPTMTALRHSSPRGIVEASVVNLIAARQTWARLSVMLARQGGDVSDAESETWPDEAWLPMLQQWRSLKAQQGLDLCTAIEQIRGRIERAFEAQQKVFKSARRFVMEIQGIEDSQLKEFVAASLKLRMGHKLAWEEAELILAATNSAGASLAIRAQGGFIWTDEGLDEIGRLAPGIREKMPYSRRQQEIGETAFAEEQFAATWVDQDSRDREQLEAIVAANEAADTAELAAMMATSEEAAILKPESKGLPAFMIWRNPNEDWEEFKKRVWAEIKALQAKNEDDATRAPDR